MENARHSNGPEHTLCSCLLYSVCVSARVGCSPQAPLPVRLSRQESCGGLPLPSPGDLPDPGIEPASSALAGQLFTAEPPGKPMCVYLLSVRKVIEFICFTQGSISRPFKNRVFM